MKLYKHTPIKILRIAIRKQGFTTENLSIIEATREECVTFFKDLLKDKICPFAEGKKTAIDVREAIGAENGKSVSFSFYGLDPVDVKNIIEENLENGKR